MTESKLDQRRWDLDQTIPEDWRLPQALVDELPEGVHQNFQNLLSRDVFSEGDSAPLYQYIQERRAEMSEPFLQMMELWLQDELKHFEAMRRVLRAVFGISYDVMDRLFNERTHEIEPIAPILTDEFTILVALAFDELGSTMSYRRDVLEYYRHYPSQVHLVGRHLVADEGVHFGNAISLLTSVHSHRLGEVASVLRAILELEQKLGRYCKTFLLDHAQETFRFPPFFNERVAATILARCGQGEAAHNMQELWTWKPQGLSLVPITMDEKFMAMTTR